MVLNSLHLLEFTAGYCYKCELRSIDSKVSRGRKWSRQRIPLNGDDEIIKKIAKRTSEKAFRNSSKFKQSKTTNITQRRAEHFNYEEKPAYQFTNSVEEAHDPEFHKEICIISKRMYNRGLEFYKVQDAHLLENNISQPDQQEAFNNYTMIIPAYQSASNHYKTEKTLNSWSKRKI